MPLILKFFSIENFLRFLIMNESFQMHNNVASNNSEYISIYFYNRTDYLNIVSQLSPLRRSINKAVPKLYYVGLVMNILCAIVFCQKHLVRRKGIFYLIFLSLSDLMYNFVSLLPEFLMDIRLVDYDIFKVF